MVQINYFDFVIYCMLDKHEFDEQQMLMSRIFFAMHLHREGVTNFSEEKNKKN